MRSPPAPERTAPGALSTTGHRTGAGAAVAAAP